MVKVKIIKKNGVGKKLLTRSKVVKIRAKPTPSKLRRKKEKGNPKGVVYLSHIPHGFYEEQIENYFNQFGKVTQVSLPRSKTGKSKGYAFIEFLHPEVAQIAADTMNNYLMFNRVIKAKYLPPEEQKPRLFAQARIVSGTHTTPKEMAALKVEQYRKRRNSLLETTAEYKLAVKLLKRKKAAQNQLKELGVGSKINVNTDGLSTVINKGKNLMAQKVKENKIEETEKNTNEQELAQSSKEDEENSIISNKKPKLSPPNNLESSTELKEINRKHLKGSRQKKPKNTSTQNLTRLQKIKKNIKSEGGSLIKSNTPSSLLGSTIQQERQVKATNLETELRTNVMKRHKEIDKLDEEGVGRKKKSRQITDVLPSVVSPLTLIKELVEKEKKVFLPQETALKHKDLLNNNKSMEQKPTNKVNQKKKVLVSKSVKGKQSFKPVLNEYDLNIEVAQKEVESKKEADATKKNIPITKPPSTSTSEYSSPQTLIKSLLEKEKKTFLKAPTKNRRNSLKQGESVRLPPKIETKQKDDILTSESSFQKRDLKQIGGNKKAVTKKEKHTNKGTKKTEDSNQELILKKRKTNLSSSKETQNDVVKVSFANSKEKKDQKHSKIVVNTNTEVSVNIKNLQMSEPDKASVFSPLTLIKELVEKEEKVFLPQETAPKHIDILKNNKSMEQKPTNKVNQKKKSLVSKSVKGKQSLKPVLNEYDLNIEVGQKEMESKKEADTTKKNIQITKPHSTSENSSPQTLIKYLLEKEKETFLKTPTKNRRSSLKQGESVQLPPKIEIKQKGGDILTSESSFQKRDLKQIGGNKKAVTKKKKHTNKGTKKNEDSNQELILKKQKTNLSSSKQTQNDELKESVHSNAGKRSKLAKKKTSLITAIEKKYLNYDDSNTVCNVKEEAIGKKNKGLKKEGKGLLKTKPERVPDKQELVKLLLDKAKNGFLPQEPTKNQKDVLKKIDSKEQLSTKEDILFSNSSSEKSDSKLKKGNKNTPPKKIGAIKNLKKSSKHPKQTGKKSF